MRKYLGGNSSSSSSGGIGVFGAFGVLFVGLKLTGFISWSWWWVLSPFWIYALIVALVVVLILAMSK